MKGDNDLKEISMTRGQSTVVDDDKYDELNKLKWQASWSPSTKTFYALSGRFRDVGLNMARLIMNAPDGIFVDHINGDTLDNRAENLRLATNRQNQQNQHRAKTSVFPGVGWHKAGNKWRSRISVGGKSIYLGNFSSERDAFDAYLDACKIYGFPIDQMVDKFGLANNQSRDRICPYLIEKNIKPKSNNTSGITGVHWSAKDQRWVAQVQINGKRTYLGGFNDIDDAVTARKDAEIKYYSELEGR